MDLEISSSRRKRMKKVGSLSMSGWGTLIATGRFVLRSVPRKTETVRLRATTSSSK